MSAAQGGHVRREVLLRAEQAVTVTDAHQQADELFVKDGFFISDPGFEHCKNADTVCAWKKVG
ncbi:hypothetical protein [Streptomyces sp. NPDC001139]